ncbi:uncharacterized protein C4orf54 homolog [Hippocampus zosterae]|uniref:uncharacterized protein C4orf54 homolog n=1 Tax=Hippocampus zosterae TaxID=109293 RepID=UPI00223E3421|nr:uncharacterized protein C4orf54 homolog [Hippocampus zosterae]XP_051939389.1 uncharacterized protein C4orf54 homolog [Hippocampus zosterae]
MEAAEETLTYRDDPGPHRTLLPGGKAKDTGGHFETKSESNYVDLDMRPEGAKTVKVTFTGEGSQLSVKSDASKHGARGPASVDSADTCGGDDPSGSTLKTRAELSDEEDSGDETRPREEADPSDCSEGDELQYTDMYLNSRSESDDGASAVLSDHSGADTLKDESHYITTHEIQLTELDHDVDYDLGRGASWDFEDDNLVYSFVDYASFESDDTRTGTLVLEGRGQVAKLGVSTEQDDSDLGDSEKCASSDESVCKNRIVGDKIHVSVQSSREEPVGIPDEGAKRFGDGSHFSFVRAGPLGDSRAKYFIPAPGRQHLATKLRRKDIHEYSSGASSSISELDDADKEVRNLTARSFRSLACPYFDTIHLSTSSESSMSEYGLNKWSAYMDWNYGRIPRGAERGVIARKTSSATLEMNETAGSKRAPQPNKRLTFHQEASFCKGAGIEEQRGVTLNVQCNSDAQIVTRRPKNTKSWSGEVRGAVLARSGYEMQYHHADGTDKTHKRAVFASSLLQNVISKKMQFEQERKMERGEISDVYTVHSPCSLDGGKDRRGFHRQSSESGSGYTNSGDDQPLEGSRPSSREPAEQQGSTDIATHSGKKEPKVGLTHSQGSAFDSWKDDEAAKEESDRSNMLTKLLFMPSCQRFSKEKERSECEAVLETANAATEEEKDKGGKTPEIKICLRSVREDKGGALNIASLLTPKISSVKTFRGGGDAKCHILSASDKIPNFTVRDVRDTKGKFQTPIYRVRDVRKLVKSSYRFFSLDNSDSKGAVEPAEKLEEKAREEPVKQASPSPIVIKCHSVKTNKSPKETEADALPQSAPGKVPFAGTKQANNDQSEAEKLLKQRQEKFAGEAADKRFQPRIPKQAALEKLKAAVKTMEQLYVFDRNEWKRKAQPQQPIAGSHVLSLITREERGAEEETMAAPEEGAVDVVRAPRCDESARRKTFSNKSVLHLGKSNKAHVSTSSVASPALQSTPPRSMKSSDAPAAPFSVKIEPARQGRVEQSKVQISPANPSVTQSDSENYLTMPGLAYTNEIKVANKETAYAEMKPSVSQQVDVKTPERKRLFVAEPPASSVYHQPVAGPQTQQVFCFSSPFATLSPPPSSGEAGLQTQRKMLLDPTTGHYYLVDTPIQTSTKRLFDPETGQYVDVPHSPVPPIAPVTPVPLSLPPVALNPGAFAPTYLIYPGFIPSPTLQAQALLPPLPGHSEDREKLKHTASTKQEEEANAPSAESPYYSATAEAPPGQVKPSVTSDRKPIISITTQQGPRIIAPPSFDGTTMSFVVEHR